MISTYENIAAGTLAKTRRLKITSPVALDAAVANIVGLKNQYTTARAAADAELVAVEQRHQLTLTSLADRLSEAEGEVQEYCDAHRAELFTDKKSRETALADFGYEITPPRVETTSRRVTWKDVVGRLGRLSWGKAYLAQAEPKPDKNALLADREKLTSEQLTAAGIQFRQDEQFYVRPKLETAAASSVRTAVGV